MGSGPGHEATRRLLRGRYRIGNRPALRFRFLVMRVRAPVVAAVVLVAALAACSGGDAELSSGSTIITGGTNAPVTSTSTTLETADQGSPTQTLTGEPVSEYTVVERVPNDNGEEFYIVIPDGGYTDVDLENFILELLDKEPTMYGAEVFDDEQAVAAFKVDPADRTDAQKELLDRHHFVTLVDRDRIEFNGPFADFSGGAIGS